MAPKHSNVTRAVSGVAMGAAGVEGSASDEAHPFEENRRADESGRD
jgi:hypothetical protein